MVGQCKDCIYFKPTDHPFDNTGQCLKNPPTVVSCKISPSWAVQFDCKEEDKIWSHKTVFPTPKETESCGEFLKNPDSSKTAR